MSGYLDPAGRRARTAALAAYWRARGMSAAGLRRALGEPPGALDRRLAEAELLRLAAGVRARPEVSAGAAQVSAKDQVKSNGAAPSRRAGAGSGAGGPPSTEAVIAAVAAAAGLGPHVVRAGDGTHRVSPVRHLAMALARELGGESYAAIAGAFGCVHQAVVYGCRMTEVRLEVRRDARLRAIARRARARLEGL